MSVQPNKCVTLILRVTSANYNGVPLISKHVTAVLLVPGFLLMQGLLPAQSASDAPLRPVAAEAPGATPAETPVVPPPATHAILPGEPGSTQDKRIAGILPNYRTADSTTPFAPLTVGQKWKIATKDTFDYPSYVLAGAFAGLSQLDNSNPSFGQGLKGYAKRYAAGIADQDMGNFMTEAIYPTLLHEDPRYFRKVDGSVKSRLLWAVDARSDHKHGFRPFALQYVGMARERYGGRYRKSILSERARRRRNVAAHAESGGDRHDFGRAQGILARHQETLAPQAHQQRKHRLILNRSLWSRLRKAFRAVTKNGLYYSSRVTFTVISAVTSR